MPAPSVYDLPTPALLVEREAEVGFQEAYAGHRWLRSGDIITPPGGGVHVDPMAAPVTMRRLEITAEAVGWSGNKAEFVARHLLDLGGEDATQEVHVKIEKRLGSWSYTSFIVRGRGEIAEPNAGNPWTRALRLGKGS